MARSTIQGLLWEGPGGGAEHIVLVHGLAIGSSMTVPAAERLAARFTVSAPDLPGSGRSTAPSRALDIGELGEAVGEWAAAVSDGRVVVAGISIGSQVAVETAVGRPDLVSALVLAGADR